MTTTSNTDPNNFNECPECGGNVPKSKTRPREYCSQDCLKTFNNRRAQRGMILHDLMMINRHERGLAKKAKVFFLMTRLAMHWRDEDFRERDGRRSWRRPSKVIEGVQWARATVVDRQS